MRRAFPVGSEAEYRGNASRSVRVTDFGHDRGQNKQLLGACLCAGCAQTPAEILRLAVQQGLQWGTAALESCARDQGLAVVAAEVVPVPCDDDVADLIPAHDARVSSAVPDSPGPSILEIRCLS